MSPTQESGTPALAGVPINKVMCKLTRYGDRTIEAWECRVSGYAPKPAPGRKAKKAA